MQPQFIGILVRLSNCTAIICIRAQLGILFLYFGDSALEGNALVLGTRGCQKAMEVMVIRSG